jgi:hypothetical protein
MQKKKFLSCQESVEVGQPRNSTDGTATDLFFVEIGFLYVYWKLLALA